MWPRKLNSLRPLSLSPSLPLKNAIEHERKRKEFVSCWGSPMNFRICRKKGVKQKKPRNDNAFSISLVAQASGGRKDEGGMPKGREGTYDTKREEIGDRKGEEE